VKSTNEDNNGCGHLINSLILNSVIDVWDRK